MGAAEMFALERMALLIMLADADLASHARLFEPEQLAGLEHKTCTGGNPTAACALWSASPVVHCVSMDPGTLSL